MKFAALNKKTDSFLLLFYRRKGKRTNKYELSVRTTEKNGLLLWSNRGRNNQGNYFALAVVDGAVELSFNLGKEQRLLSARSNVSNESK